YASFWRGLIQFSLESSAFHFCMAGVNERFRITTGGVTVFGTFTNSSDKRLEFNVQQLTNALDVITRLEPVEYDQTYNLVDEYTPETPQSHQSGFIAQSVQNINELKHTVEGGAVGEDGVDSIRTMNYNAIFTY
ncbi:MAG: tail fiber domain-containing protein, partial [Candidatus Fonsibacter sp.]